MKRKHLALLAGSCLVGVLIVATANIAVPQVVRIALGMLVVFVLPGFALVSAVLPKRQFSSVERLLASVGMSLATATCVAVLLAAMPVGLSREPLAIVLGGITISLSIAAALRTRPRNDRRGSRNSVSTGTGP